MFNSWIFFNLTFLNQTLKTKTLHLWDAKWLDCFVLNLRLSWINQWSEFSFRIRKSWFSSNDFINYLNSYRREESFSDGPILTIPGKSGKKCDSVSLTFFWQYFSYAFESPWCVSKSFAPFSVLCTRFDNTLDNVQIPKHRSSAWTMYIL